MRYLGSITLGVTSVLGTVSFALAQPVAPLGPMVDGGLDAGTPLVTTADAGALDASDAALANDAEIADGNASFDASPPPLAATSDAAVEPAPVHVAPQDDAGAPAGPSDVGVHVGVRVGYAAPFGLLKDVAIGDVVSGAVPFGVDIGYFFDPRFYAGLSLAYGYVITSSNVANLCPSDPNDSCSADLIRIAASTAWHFRPKETLDPWAGFSLGYEVLNISEQDADGNPVSSAASHGFELGLQGGVDFKPKHFYGFGPYVEVNAGHYWGPGVYHGWAGLGIRLRTGL